MALALLGLMMPLVSSNYMDTDAVYRKEKLPTSRGMRDPPEEVTNQATEYEWLSRGFTKYGERTAFYIGSLTCPNKHQFCATMTYEWTDSSNDTVLMAYVPLHCTKDGTINHSAMVLFDQGKNHPEEFFVNGTVGTVIVRILHTCHYAFRIREQVSTLEIPPKFEPNRYQLNITDSDEVTRPMTAERVHFPVDAITAKWLKRVDVRNTLERLGRFKPVTVRTLHNSRDVRLVTYAWNQWDYESRCQHSTFDDFVYCSETNYGYFNKHLHSHHGVRYGSEQDKFTRVGLGEEIKYRD